MFNMFLLSETTIVNASSFQKLQWNVFLQFLGFLVGQGFCCLNKGGQCSRLVFSWIIKGSVGSGSKFWRLLRILCKWWKRSKNAPTAQTSELDHITGPFLASWAPVLAQHYCLSVLNTLCAATATSSTRYTAHSSPVCQGVVLSLACLFGISVSEHTLKLPAWILSSPSLSPGCTLYKHPHSGFNVMDFRNSALWRWQDICAKLTIFY